jgi:hypothetical protein
MRAADSDDEGPNLLPITQALIDTVRPAPPGPVFEKTPKPLSFLPLRSDLLPGDGHY